MEALFLFLAMIGLSVSTILMVRSWRNAKKENELLNDIYQQFKMTMQDRLKNA